MLLDEVRCPICEGLELPGQGHVFGCRRGDEIMVIEALCSLPYHVTPGGEKFWPALDAFRRLTKQSERQETKMLLEQALCVVQGDDQIRTGVRVVATDPRPNDPGALTEREKRQSLGWVGIPSDRVARRATADDDGDTSRSVSAPTEVRDA